MNDPSLQFRANDLLSNPNTEPVSCRLALQNARNLKLIRFVICISPGQDEMGRPRVERRARKDQADGEQARQMRTFCSSPLLFSSFPPICDSATNEIVSPYPRVAYLVLGVPTTCDGRERPERDKTRPAAATSLGANERGRGEWSEKPFAFAEYAWQVCRALRARTHGECETCSARLLKLFWFQLSPRLTNSKTALAS